VLAVAWEDAGATEWFWHSSDQGVAFPQVRTTQFGGLLRRKKPGRLVEVSPVANVSELDQSDVAGRILVLGFDPVAVTEHVIGTDKVSDAG
jgi:hypothetical protein